jgi:hypothetical protein
MMTSLQGMDGKQIMASIEMVQSPLRLNKWNILLANLV